MQVINQNETGQNGYSFGLAEIEGRPVQVFVHARNMKYGNFAHAGAVLIAEHIDFDAEGKKKYPIARGLTGETRERPIHPPKHHGPPFGTGPHRRRPKHHTPFGE